MNFQVDTALPRAAGPGLAALGGFRRRNGLAEDEEGHIVALGGATGEGLKSGEDALNAGDCGWAVLLENGIDEALFSPLDAAGIDGLGDAVGVGSESIAEFEGEGLLLVGRVLKEADVAGHRIRAWSPGCRAAGEAGYDRR